MFDITSFASQTASAYLTAQLHNNYVMIVKCNVDHAGRATVFCPWDSHAEDCRLLQASRILL